MSEKDFNEKVNEVLVLVQVYKELTKPLPHNFETGGIVSANAGEFTLPEKRATFSDFWTGMQKQSLISDFLKEKE